MDRPTPQQLRRWSPHRRQPWTEFDRWDRTSLAVDCVLMTFSERHLHVVLHRRETPPHENEWALPGVIVDYKERYEDAVCRALKMKARLDVPPTEIRQVESWNYPDRDERGWVTTVLFMGLVPISWCRSQLVHAPADVLLGQIATVTDEGVTLRAGGLQRIDKLAFDHSLLIARAVGRLRQDARVTPVLLDFLPERFAMRDLKEVYETVTGEHWNRATFHKRVVEDYRWVRPTAMRESDAIGHRPAALFARR